MWLGGGLGCGRGGVDEAGKVWLRQGRDVVEAGRFG